MSKKHQSGSPSGVPEFTEEEITESFELARAKGEVTDLMGNPMGAGETVAWEIGEEKDLSFTQIMGVMNGLQGKVLTIIDATFIDKERSKYVKDLIKDSFVHQADWLFELKHKPVVEPSK